MFKWIGQSSDGSEVTLKRVSNFSHLETQFPEDWLAENQDELLKGIALDVETTGLRSDRDEVIEFAYRQFLYHRALRTIVRVDDGLSLLNQPSFPIPKKITALTGIDDVLVRGHRIDWDQVSNELNNANLVIAHNASFDRAFVDKHVSYSRSTIWSCSMSQIDWMSLGFRSQKLELLAMYNGFFSDSHRAINDVNLMLGLLTDFREQGTNYFRQLLDNAFQSRSTIWFLETKPSDAGIYRNLGFSWSPVRRGWFKSINFAEADKNSRMALELASRLGCSVEIQSRPISENFK